MGWTHCYEEHVELPPAALWPVLADIAAWPESDHNIERLDITEPPAPGVRFTLKPRAGPRLSMQVAEFTPPVRYADICRLPLARMITVHELQPHATGTRIVVSLRFEGPLGWVWGRLIGQQHAQGLPTQTRRFVTRARQLTGGLA